MKQKNQEILVPEDRLRFPQTSLLDKSVCDGLLRPEEPLEPEKNRTGDCVEALLQDFIERETSKDSRVLVFEPTRTEIRRAILRAGRSYIDGGRLLCGRPDPATLALALEQEPGLVILDVEDKITLPERIPVLIDRRSQPTFAPMSSKHPTTRVFSLFQLNPRHGLSSPGLAWISEPQQPPHDALSWMNDASFVARSSERARAMAKWFDYASLVAQEAGFDTLVQFGFLWLCIPGVSSESLAKSFLDSGVQVFYSNHHPYRQRIRLCPAAKEDDTALWSAIEAVGAQHSS